jgi:hypothetical protein
MTGGRGIPQLFSLSQPAMDMPRRPSVVPLAVALLAPSLLLAQVYKWVDERGVTHYGEKPPPASVRESRVKSLDIELTGNDPPPRRGECYTIQCQYERMRADRLEREEESRKEWELRQRAAVAQKQAEAAAAAAQARADDRWSGGRPIYGRPIYRPVVPGVPGGRPMPQPQAPRGEPGVSLKSFGE